MKIIGLCGQSGSGKTTVSDYFSNKGFIIFDCDKIYHELVSKKSECLIRLAEEFGDIIINNDSLDRTELSKIVFKDIAKLKKLNEITHPFVISDIKKRISVLPENSKCIIDAPLLFEAKINEWCDFVIGIISSRENKIKRLTERDNIDQSIADKRLNNQYSNEFLIENCDIVIDNNSTLEALYNKCDSIIASII